MATTEEKFNLIRDAALLLTKQEFRGNLLNEFRPRVSIVIDKDYDEGESKYTHTSIRLEYPNEKVGETPNWMGIGESVDDALDSNLLSFEYEIQDRLVALQELLLKVRGAMPDKFKHHHVDDMNRT